MPRGTNLLCLLALEVTIAQHSSHVFSHLQIEQCAETFGWIIIPNLFCHLPLTARSNKNASKLQVAPF